MRYWINGPVDPDLVSAQTAKERFTEADKDLWDYEEDIDDRQD